MTPTQFVKPAGAVAAVALLGLAGTLITSPRVHADSSSSDSRVQIGYNIVPVGLQLNLKGLNHDLVGVGSYIVNGQADCNGCHTTNAATEYNDPGTPFFNQHPALVNLSTYLAGGMDFGPVGAGLVNGVVVGPGPFGPGPDIITRNLTPDYTGLPEGGHSFSDFLTIIRTGKDFDMLHPNCVSPTATPNCYYATPGNEIDGDLLQIMPWPTFGHMSDNDLQAIWEYLSAVPCNANAGSPYPWVVNQCTAPTAVKH